MKACATQPAVLNFTISCISFLIPAISYSQDAGNAEFVQVEKEIKQFIQVEMKILVLLTRYFYKVLKQIFTALRFLGKQAQNLCIGA